MLKVPAPFPQVGSFALMIDDLMPVDMQRAELVRIQHRGDGGTVHITWPMRVGASGFRVVNEAELIDGTPLSKDEERELTDLLNYVRARVRPNREKIERAEVLRKRLLFSQLLDAEQRKLGRLQARQQHSSGSHLPREAAA